VRILGQSHLIEQAAQVTHLAWRPGAAAALGAHRVQGAGDPAVPFGIVAQRVPEYAAVGDQLGQLLFEAGNRMRFAKAEGVSRCFGPIAETIPGFAFFALFAAEQNRLRFLAADQYDHRFGFREAAQVPEIAVESIGIVRVAVAQALGCGRDDGNAVAEAGQHALATVRIGLVIHAARASSLSSAARRSGVPTSTQRPACRSPLIIPRPMPVSSNGRSFMAVPRAMPAKNSGRKTPMPA
jgi:hypothetical protein